MPTISLILAAHDHRDDTDAAICDLVGLTASGGYAMREPDGRLLVWASEADSQDDDGARATYRSRAPITDAEWQAVCRLAWIDAHGA